MFRLSSFRYDSVSLQTNSKKRIDAWYNQVDSGIAKGTVILFHGLTGNKTTILQQANEFRYWGYNVMLIDSRSHGSSDGNSTTIGFRESEEVKLAGLTGHKIVGEGKVSLETLGEKFNLQNQTQELQSVLDALGIKELTTKIMNVFTVKGDKEYGISYGVPAPEILGDQYSLYLPVVQKMIDSMQLTNQTNS